MAIRTLFQPDGATVYQAADFMLPWDRLLTDGVFGMADFSVLSDAPADLGVSALSGCLKKSISGSGYIVKSDTNVKIPITANTSGYNRIDLIVLEIDTTNNVTTIKAVQGIPSSNPAAPTATVNQIALAEVLVGNNASAIDANVITDQRVMLAPRITGIQSGSNENGTFVKFPDGTMICTTFVHGTAYYNAPWGSLYDVTISIGKAWAGGSFTSDPYVSAIETHITGVGADASFVEWVTYDKDKITDMAIARAISTTNPYNFSVIAIGRWK